MCQNRCTATHSSPSMYISTPRAHTPSPVTGNGWHYSGYGSATWNTQIPTLHRCLKGFSRHPTIRVYCAIVSPLASIAVRPLIVAKRCTLASGSGPLCACDDFTSVRVGFYSTLVHEIKFLRRTCCGARSRLARCAEYMQAALPRERLACLVSMGKECV